MFGEHLLKRFVYLAFHSVSCYTHHKWVYTFCRIDHPLLIQQVFIDSKKIITYCVFLHFEFCREISNFPSSHQSCYRCHLKKSFLVTVWDQPLWSFPSFAGPNGQQYADRSQRELPHLRHWLVHIRQGCAGFWRRLHPSAGDGHEVRQLPHGWTRPDWWARERRVWRNYKLYIVVWGENYMSIHLHIR